MYFNAHSVLYLKISRKSVRERIFCFLIFLSAGEFLLTKASLARFSIASASSAIHNIGNRGLIKSGVKDESAKDFIKRLLPQESINRSRLMEYSLLQGIEKAPHRIEIRGREAAIEVHWKLTNSKEAQEYVDSIQIQNLDLGLFLVNEEKFLLTPTAGIASDLMRVEEILSLKMARHSENSGLARALRADPYPREKGGVFLLSVMYSLYFSQPHSRCLEAELMLSQHLKLAKIKLLDIPRCEKGKLEVIVQRDKNHPRLELNWIDGVTDQLLAVEFSESKGVLRSMTYEFDSWGLKNILIRDSSGRHQIFTTQFGGSNMVTPEMLIEFRTRYDLLDKLRNAGSDWGLTCVNGCHQEIIAHLAQPRESIARQEPKVRRPASARKKIAY
ncbi:MAG: hypothetical protein IPL83_14310 [Bdellovibrionales bacterium]|nr:hypothetical protein [Bdellovibrionales bacterium]